MVAFSTPVFVAVNHLFSILHRHFRVNNSTSLVRLFLLMDSLLLCNTFLFSIFSS